MYLMRERAYAKINLYLRVGARRADGYHELCTVFQQISLYDGISLLRHKRGGITLRCNLPWVPCDGRNLAYRAAEAFFAETGLRNTGLTLGLEKHIPVGAGLAGGSTDAACVLRLLNRAYGTPLSAVRMQALALSLGADVPFCLRGGTAIAGGVGERLRPVAPLEDCAIVVCKPGFSVSTKMAFGLFDAFERADPPDETAMLDALRRQDVRGVAAALYNSLEAPVAAHRPDIAALRERLLALGALGARMTGSGAAVYGIFLDHERACEAHASLHKQYRESFLVKPGGTT